MGSFPAREGNKVPLCAYNNPYRLGGEGGRGRSEFSKRGRGPKKVKNHCFITWLCCCTAQMMLPPITLYGHYVPVFLHLLCTKYSIL